jgi:hypothetical protein
MSARARARLQGASLALASYGKSALAGVPAASKNGKAPAGLRAGALDWTFGGSAIARARAEFAPGTMTNVRRLPFRTAFSCSALDKKYLKRRSRPVLCQPAAIAPRASPSKRPNRRRLRPACVCARFNTKRRCRQALSPFREAIGCQANWVSAILSPNWQFIWSTAALLIYRTASMPNTGSCCFIAAIGDHIVAGSWSASRRLSSIWML